MGPKAKKAAKSEQADKKTKGGGKKKVVTQVSRTPRKSSPSSLSASSPLESDVSPLENISALKKRALFKDGAGDATPSSSSSSAAASSSSSSQPPRVSPTFPPRRPPPPAFVPTYINKNIGYTSASICASTPLTSPATTISGDWNWLAERRAFTNVSKLFVLPADFENDKRWGPKSGITHEQRVLSAYALGKLTPKNEDGAPSICLHCGEVGHLRRDCELL